MAQDFGRLKTTATGTERGADDETRRNMIINGTITHRGIWVGAMLSQVAANV